VRRGASKTEGPWVPRCLYEEASNPGFRQFTLHGPIVMRNGSLSTSSVMSAVSWPMPSQITRQPGSSFTASSRQLRSLRSRRASLAALNLCLPVPTFAASEMADGPPDDGAVE